MRGRRQAICRRRFLRRSLAGAGGLAAAQALGWTDLVKLHAEDLRRRGMACILLWMQGGPSQFETFDPKLGGDSGGPTKAIPTAVPGIHIAEHWPRVARGMKDIAIIRSMTNREGNHQRATYQLHTGYVPTASVKYPTFGSVVSERLGDRELDLPSHVLLGRAGNQKLGGGYLGVDHDPFVVLRSGQRPDNTEPAVGRERLGRRLGLLGRLEGDFEAWGGGRLVTDPRSLYRRASRLRLSP
ncbi:MAG: DUF1501 domain-containing protein, partial [Planctomycetota bacterium]|nr:DUF1501 domain-containing protein [Planctomycetota bacterium]